MFGFRSIVSRLRFSMNRFAMIRLKPTYRIAPLRPFSTKPQSKPWWQLPPHSEEGATTMEEAGVRIAPEEHQRLSDGSLKRSSQKLRDSAKDRRLEWLRRFNEETAAIEYRKMIESMSVSEFEEWCEQKEKELRLAKRWREVIQERKQPVLSWLEGVDELNRQTRRYLAALDAGVLDGLEDGTWIAFYQTAYVVGKTMRQCMDKVPNVVCAINKYPLRKFTVEMIE